MEFRQAPAERDREEHRVQPAGVQGATMRPTVRYYASPRIKREKGASRDKGLTKEEEEEEVVAAAMVVEVAVVVDSGGEEEGHRRRKEEKRRARG